MAAVGQGQGEDLMRQISRTFSGQSRYDEYEEDKEDKPISKAEDWKMMPEVKIGRAHV